MSNIDMLPFVIKELSLQYEQDGKWETVFTESDVKKSFDKRFTPVDAQNFRLMLKGEETRLEAQCKGAKMNKRLI